MSDEEYEYDYGSDYGDMDEEGGPENEIAIEIENSFYEAEDEKKENNLSRALELFLKVNDLETEHKGDEVVWRFKALTHAVTIYHTMGDSNQMIVTYRRMLSYITNTSVTRNECTDAINSVLDAISVSTDTTVLSQMYEITLEALRTANNERLWFNTNLKLAKVYLSNDQYTETEGVLATLKASCQHADGSDDLSKGSSLIEVYCLEIRLCALTGNRHRMQDVYPKTLNLKNAISHPRILGQIREEGGKMYMAEGNWAEAYNELYASFLAYQEAGDQRAKSTLKYLVVASLLALSKINPFSAKEANVYAEDKEIIAMVDLRQALEATDLPKFERVLKDKRNRIQDEPFLVKYIEPLRKRMREQVLLDITRPYSKVTFDFLVDELLMPREEVEILLIEMILDRRLQASIDQVKGCVLFNRAGPSADDRELERVEKLADILSSMSAKLCTSV